MNIIFSVLVTILFLINPFIMKIALASNNNGVIHFSGTISHSPCRIAPDQNEIGINLDQSNLIIISNTLKKSEYIPVNIIFNDCHTEPELFNIVFHKNHNLNLNYLLNTNDDEKTSKNIAIELLDDNTNKLELDGKTILPQNKLTNENNLLNLYMRYITTGDVIHGEMNSFVTIELQYN